jgi:parallel beta-helix repeat protein
MHVIEHDSAKDICLPKYLCSGETEMLKKNASRLVLFLILLDLLVLTPNIQSAGASGTIYIRADGSIDPSTAPILRSGDLYTFTNDISGSIIAEKDNIVVNGAGHTLQGTGEETGIDLSGRTNVIIQNMRITTFDYAVYLSSSSRITVSETNIADSSSGIWISYSSNNNITGNSITANVFEGIYLFSSSYNSIAGNNITANTFDGIYLFSSSNNTISGNNITNNGDGVTSYYSSDNNVFHNNFISNFEQAYSESSTDIWDNAYPSGGNYWNNYAGVDKKCGPSQDHSGNDGLGDTPYTIDSNNQDNYPLMNPWTPPAGHNVAIISVISAKTVIGQGYSGNITVYGANKGEYLETFSVTTYADVTPIASTTVPLGSGSTTSITFSWNTNGTPRGNYTISAYAEPVPSETDTSDNNFTDGWILVSVVGDVSGDGKVNLVDVFSVALAYGSVPGMTKWNPNLDVNNDGRINLIDYFTTALNYGKS